MDCNNPFLVHSHALTTVAAVPTNDSATSYNVVLAPVDQSLSREKIVVDVDYENNYIEHRGHRYSIGTLGKLYPDSIFSPTGRYAVGRFFFMEDGQYYLYLLSESGNPKRLHKFIEEVGSVEDNGAMIYYIGGEIARGHFDRSGERILVPDNDVEAMYIAFASFDAENLLYWGLPTQPEGLNMDKLNTITGKITPVISDHSVLDALIAPDREIALVNRYYDGKTSSWTYSFATSKFVRLPSEIDTLGAVWSPDSKKIAYWEGCNVCIVDSNGNNKKILKGFSHSDMFVGRMIGFDRNTIVLYNTPSI